MSQRPAVADLIVRRRDRSASIPEVDVLLFVVSFPSEEWRDIGGAVFTPYVVAVVIHHFDVGRATEGARKKLRTRRCWAIAARCVFGVVWHIGSFQCFQSSLSAAMPELVVRPFRHLREFRASGTAHGLARFPTRREV